MIRYDDPERTKDDLWRHLHDVHKLKLTGFIGHYVKSVLVEIHRETHKRESGYR